MPRTVTEGFNDFNSWLIPTATERTQQTSHKQSIYDKLDAKYGLYRMFQSGSFAHGTGIRSHSDVDYFVSLKNDRPTYSYTILNSMKSTLQEKYPLTYIHVSRPAVVLEFGQGSERVEIIPAYANETVGETDKEKMRFRIPAANGIGEWLYSTPELHLSYVSGSDINVATGSTKRLTRLVKAWKYYRDVPISSFYLEMRAGEWMRKQNSYIPYIDLYYFLSSLHTSDLASMNDPTGSTGRIHPCSSDANHTIAMSKLNTATTRAKNAMEAVANGKVQQAFENWDLLYNGKFPSY